MTMLLLALVFVAATTGLFTIGAAILAPSSALGVRLHALLGYKTPPAPRKMDRLERALEPLAKAVPQSPEKLSMMRQLLIRAGYREDRHVTLYVGLRVASAALFFLIAGVTGMIAHSILLAFAMPALGYMIPRFLLKRQVAIRQEKIQLALPDALDMAVICVESGLGLDQALARVGMELRNTHPDLSAEIELLTLEVRAGKPREEALRNLGVRTGVDDIRAFVAVLIQTDRFGTSIAQALRVHSDALRTERRQRAEERAAKTTIKMIPVLVVFIFPVMFFVILGPVVIQLVRDVLPSITR